MLQMLRFIYYFTGSNYQKCQMSWLDQRQMMYHAVEALGNHPVVSDIIKEVKQIQPKLPTLDGEYICCGKSRELVA